MGIRARVLEQRHDDNLSDKPQVALVVDAVLDTCLAFEVVATGSLRASGVVLSRLFRVHVCPMAYVPIGAQYLRQQVLPAHSGVALGIFARRAALDCSSSSSSF